MKKVLTIAFVVLVASNINAQRWNDWDWDDDSWYDYSTPFIEFNAGLSEIKHDAFINKFSDVGLGELKLGFSSRDSFYKGVVFEMEDKYFFVSNLSTELHVDEPEAVSLDSKLWRFGFGKRSGYGYDFSGFGIFPYTTSGYSLSKLQMSEYPFVPLEDIKVLDRFNEAIRFGSTVEGGLQLSIVNTISFDIGYEASTIFPRYLIWKHLGSAIIEEAGLSFLDHFIDEVVDASPAVGPIINFLLKNGYRYAAYSLKKGDMNWPFPTEEPLTYETVKVGITFTF
ncbi:MAG: hypothetical protein K9J12_14150 [Melioribacteraceae bacterium]|nr:hypothetical protein [Melioribacteraceae bacterium]